MKTFKLIFPILLLLLSCEKDSFKDKYNVMYGDWSTKLIDAGTILKTTDFCDVLSFKNPNDYSLLIDNSIVESGTFEIKEQSDQNLKIELNPKNRSDDYNPLLSLYQTDLYVTVFQNDSIRINNNILDYGYISIWLSKK